jgi:DNA-binding MarR family transcriptional regulator
MPTATAADPTAVASRLRPALLRLNRELRRELHSLGVTTGQVSLLTQVQHEPGIGVGELAAREKMSAPGMSKYVARLEGSGLLRRTELPDRRRFGLELTSEGARVLARVKRIRTAWLSERLRGLSERELAKVDAAVEPLLKLLEVDTVR